MNENFEKIRAMIAEQLDLDPEKITMESDLAKDLEADSLDVLDMVMTFEETFDRTLSDEELEQIKTVGDIVKLLDE